jgi:hypothetical protein
VTETDISQVNSLLKVGTYLDMNSRVDKWYIDQKINPTDIYHGKTTKHPKNVYIMHDHGTFVDPVNKNKDGSAVQWQGAHILWDKWMDLHTRYWAYINEKKQAPNVIYLQKQAPAPVPTPGPVNTLLAKVQAALGDKFTTITRATDDVRAKEKYSFYLNSKYGQATEIIRLAKDAGMNCVDYGQLLHALAVSMGYTARYVHIYCTVSKVGHIYVELKGHEFGNTWTAVDWAATAGSKYPIGKHWCSGTKTYNPAWVMADVGA